MTFTYDSADLSRIIKNFRQDGYNFYVEYLDGSVSEYYCANDEEYNRLINLMLEQALDRQKNMNVEYLEINKNLAGIISLLLSYLTSLSVERKQATLALISFILLIISCKDIKTKRRKIKELKKYQIFFEIMDEIKEVNETELLRCVEFEPMYQIPLTINHLDEYSYGEMKRIRKNLGVLKNGE